MIVSTDIANILYRDCKHFGIKTYQGGNIPTGEVTTERIVIHAKAQMLGKYWKKDFVEVNLCVPDINGKANLIRLNELERLGNTLGDLGNYDNTSYRYLVHQIGIEEDTALKCHYINVKLLFEILNTKL